MVKALSQTPRSLHEALQTNAPYGKITFWQNFHFGRSFLNIFSIPSIQAKIAPAVKGLRSEKGIKTDSDTFPLDWRKYSKPHNNF